MAAQHWHERRAAERRHLRTGRAPINVGRVHRGPKMNTEIQLLSAVALIEALPDRRLQRGQVGTVVEALAPGVFEVEFSDDSGRALRGIPERGK